MSEPPLIRMNCRPLRRAVGRTALCLALGVVAVLCSAASSFSRPMAASHPAAVTSAIGAPVIALQIDSVNPPAGRTSGGQSIVLTGAFGGLSQVLMGGVNAAWFYSQGMSQITVTTPAHAAGAVSIDLVPVSGSTYTKPNAFAYLPTTFTDDTLVAGVTVVKAQHIIELRQVVDSLRAVAGQAGANWTDANLVPTATVIKAVHITELRTNLENVLAQLGFSPPGSYTDPSLAAGFVIKRVHVEELRQRIRNIAG